MERDKKKSWKDYGYSTYQFRIDEEGKKRLEDLANEAVALSNEKLPGDVKRITKGELATRLLTRALEEELKILRES